MERTNVGTPVTMAPEVYRREAYGFKVYEILFRQIFGLSALSSFSWCSDSLSRISI
jgi:hypothetical protein